MTQIVLDVMGEFVGIISQTFQTIIDNIFFPGTKMSLEEKFLFNAKRRESVIRDQQDRMSYLAGKDQAKDHQIAGLKDLLVRKDKEIERLRNKVRSYELRIRDLTNRFPRKR
mgnify:CR=1 FL=1